MKRTDVLVTVGAKTLATYTIIVGLIGGIAGCAASGGITAATAQSAPCKGQAVANAVGASADKAGDVKLSAAASIASAALGSLCTGLATDTPLATPVPG